MKNLKKSISLGLGVLMAAGSFAPVLNAQGVMETADENPIALTEAVKENTGKILEEKINDSLAKLIEVVIADKAEDVEEGKEFVSQKDFDEYKNFLLEKKTELEKKTANKEDTAEYLAELNKMLDEKAEAFKKLTQKGTKHVPTVEEQLEALKAEKAALEKELATSKGENKELKTKIENLNKRIKELEEQAGKVNKLFLERVLKTLKSVKKNDLVKADREKYEKVLLSAQLVFGNKTATQAEIDQEASKVLDFLYTAKYEDTVADQRELKKILEDAKKIKEKDLARRDWSDLQKLIKEAEEILADRQAPQRDVDAIAKDIDKLITDIISYKLDIEDLTKLVEAAGKIDVEKFARRDRYEFEKCLDEAKSLLRDPSATQREVDRAYDNLNDFLKDIVKDGGDIAKDVAKILGGTTNSTNIDVQAALSKTRALFNLPVVETKTIDASATLSNLRYVFTIGSSRFAEVTNQAINVYQMDSAPFIQNSRTMVPLRYAAYTLQADVAWDPFAHTATFTKNGISAYVTMGSNLVRMSNGQNFNMDQIPVVRNRRLYVSISNIATMFGEKSGIYNDGQDNRIEWDANNRAVIVYVAK